MLAFRHPLIPICPIWVVFRTEDRRSLLFFISYHPISVCPLFFGMMHLFALV